jgi:hypothetical protein
MNLPVWLTTSYLALLPTGEEDILFSFMLICTYRPVRHQECWTHTLNIWPWWDSTNLPWMHIQHTVSGTQIRCVLQNFNRWHQLQQNLNVRAAISFTSRQGMGSHCYSCRWRLAYGVFLVDCLKLILIFLPIIFLQTLTRDVIFLRGGESKITLDTTYLSDPMSYWYLPWWKKIF